MNVGAMKLLVAAGSLLVFTGCISHEETVYRDVARAPVEFENDKAARLFYETLDRSSSGKDRAESRTEVQLPLIFSDKRKVISGPNAAFNKAVEHCDANRDGRITELEAQIFADRNP